MESSVWNEGSDVRTSGVCPQTLCPGLLETHAFVQRLRIYQSQKGHFPCLLLRSPPICRGMLTSQVLCSWKMSPSDGFIPLTGIFLSRFFIFSLSLGMRNRKGLSFSCSSSVNLQHLKGVTASSLGFLQGKQAFHSLTYSQIDLVLSEPAGQCDQLAFSMQKFFPGGKKKTAIEMYIRHSRVFQSVLGKGEKVL